MFIGALIYVHQGGPKKWEQGVGAKTRLQPDSKMTCKVIDRDKLSLHFGYLCNPREGFQLLSLAQLKCRTCRRCVLPSLSKKIKFCFPSCSFFSIDRKKTIDQYFFFFLPRLFFSRREINFANVFVLCFKEKIRKQFRDEMT